MMLDVPFYRQTNSNSCGVVSAKMVLEYFDIVVDIDEMYHHLNITEDRPILSTEILILLNMCGVNSTLYSKTNLLNGNIPLGYENILNKNLLVIKKLNLNFIVKKVNIEFIKECINNKCPIICLLNFHNRGLHYVPIVGVDTKNVYIHDFNEQNVKLTFSEFNTLFENSKTDCDVLVVNI